MTDSSAQPVDNEAEAQLVQAACLDHDGWCASDLSDMLQDQLAAPLILGPSQLNMLDLSAAELAKYNTFGKLFYEPAPPLELLRQVKQFAQDNDDNSCHPLPRKLSMLFYYAAIAVAFNRYGKLITSMRQPKLVQGFCWVLRQGWIDVPMRELFQQAHDGLDDQSKTPLQTPLTCHPVVKN